MQVREKIKKIVESIVPIDNEEKEHQDDVIQWINSGTDIFRITKPDNPPKHLVSYFILIDEDYVLLVDHKKAGLWLPSGGHVEIDEDPKETVVRELKEELFIDAEFVDEKPQFITVTETVGLTAGHIDVSLWYVLKGDRSRCYTFDKEEFNEIRWFHIDEIPFEKSDPHMKRMVEKLKLLGKNNERN